MHLNLNAGMSLADAFYDRFFSQTTNQQKQTMQYIVNRTQTEQIVIDAETPKEAMEKVKAGEGQITATSENYNAMPRPGQPQPATR